jgi:hypothetical protein
MSQKKVNGLELQKLKDAQAFIDDSVVQLELLLIQAKRIQATHRMTLNSLDIGE